MMEKKSPKMPSPEKFRRARWIRRKRSLISFFVFLGVIITLLFFDYYLNFISKKLIFMQAKEVEEKAGKNIKVSEAERTAIFQKVKDLMMAGKMEEARIEILKYLEREKSAEGNYLAALVYLRHGDIHSSYRYLKEALKINPDYYEAKQKLAELYLTVGDFKAAQKEASLIEKQDSLREEAFLLQTEIAQAEGKIEEALSKITAAVEEGKKKGKLSPRVLIRQATLYATQKNLKRASDVISRVELSKLDAQGYLALARYYNIIGDTEKVLTILNEARARFSEQPEVSYYYAFELMRRGEFLKASDIFKQVLSAMPNSRIVAYRYGQSLLAAGKTEEARILISQILDKFPSDILALSLKVRYQLQKNDYQGAIDTLKFTISLVPEAPRPHTLIAELYWNEGIFSMAEKYAMNAIKLGEKSLSPRVVLGDVYMKQGRYEQAIEQYSRILEREPTNLLALSQISDAWLNLGNSKRALEYCNKVLLHYPNLEWMKKKKELIENLDRSPMAFMETARKHFEQSPNDARTTIAYVQALIINNRPADAISLLRKAIKRDPNNRWYLLTLGDLLLAKGEIQEARDIYERLVASNPRDVNLLINVGGRYEKINLDKKAEELYLKAYMEDKNNLVVINQLAWFYTDVAGELNKAKPFIDILHLKGEGAFEKDTVGWYYYRMGNYQTAERFFREALQLEPSNHAIRAHLALALYKEGKVKMAGAEKEKVINMIPAGKLREELIKVAGEVVR